MFLDRLPRRLPALRCAAAASALACNLVGAQPAQTAALPPPAPTAEMTPAERAQRDADKVFKWILIHSDKPRRPSAAPEKNRDDKPAVSVRAKPAVRTPVPASAEPAAAPAMAATAATPVATPQSEMPAPAATPGAVALPPLTDTALASTDSASTRFTLPSLPAPAEEQDEVLRPLVRTEPKFPSNLLRTLTKGEVRVRFTVQPDGSVIEPSVVTTTDSRLRPASLAAVAQWRFAPLRRAQTGVVDLVFDYE